MSEEVKEGMSTLKKTILGVVTTAVTGAGVYITTNINKIFGIEDETDAKVEQLIETQQAQQANQPAPIVLNIENNNTQQQQSSGGTNTIIKETVREVPAQTTPAPAPVEEKPETPQERMARLKKQKAEQNGGN